MSLFGTVNSGYEILRERQLPNGLIIVLGHKPESKTSPFVTWLYNDETACFSYGHYFPDEREATQDYHERD